MVDPEQTLNGKASTRISSMQAINVLDGNARRREYDGITLTGKDVIVGHPDLGIRAVYWGQAGLFPPLRPHPVLMTPLNNSIVKPGIDTGFLGILNDGFLDHGTKTASVICGTPGKDFVRDIYDYVDSATNTNYAAEMNGVATWEGVAPGAKLVPYDVGGFVLTGPIDMAAAIEHSIKMKASVISMSLASSYQLHDKVQGYESEINEAFKVGIKTSIVVGGVKLELDLKVDFTVDIPNVLDQLQIAEDNGIIVCSATGQLPHQEYLGLIADLIRVRFPADRRTVIACCGATQDPTAKPNDPSWKRWGKRWADVFWEGKVYSRHNLGDVQRFTDGNVPFGQVQIAAPATQITAATYMDKRGIFDRDRDLHRPSVHLSEGSSYATAQVAGVAALWVERWSAWLKAQGLNRAKVFRWVLTSCGMTDIPGCGLFLDADLIIGCDLRTKLTAADKAKLK